MGDCCEYSPATYLVSTNSRHLERRAADTTSVVVETGAQDGLKTIDWKALESKEGEHILADARDKFSRLQTLHEAFTKEVKQQLPPGRSSDARYLDNFRTLLMDSALARWWCELRPRDFVLILAALRPTREEHDFLSRLSVTCHESFVAGPSKETCFVQSMRENKHHEITYPRRQYHVECTAAMHVFPESGALDQALVLRAMLETRNTKIFMTPLGLAVISRAWKSKVNRTRAAYMAHFVMICLLLHFAHKAYRRKMPGGMELGLYFLFFVFDVVCRLAEIMGACYAYGMDGREGSVFWIRQYALGLWRSSFMLMHWSSHWVSVLITIHMISSWCKHSGTGSCTLDDGCWFHEHNILFMTLVLANCVGYSLRLLTWDNFGEASLPAIHAVKSKRTLYFMLFLAVVWLGAAAALFVQPLNRREIQACGRRASSAWAQDACKAFGFLDRVFNVAVMGQFGVEELEDEDPQINATLHSSFIDGMVEHGAWTPYHIGAEVWQLSVGIVIHILALNVFISIVSNEYDKYAGAAVGLLMHFRAEFIFRELLMTVALQRLLQRFGWHKSDPPHSREHLIYIKSKHNPFHERQEDVLRQVLDENKAMREAIDHLQAQVAQLRSQMRPSFF